MTVAGNELYELLADVWQNPPELPADFAANAVAAITANPDVVLRALRGERAMPGAPAYIDNVDVWVFARKWEE